MLCWQGCRCLFEEYAQRGSTGSYIYKDDYGNDDKNDDDDDGDHGHGDNNYGDDITGFPKHIALF